MINKLVILFYIGQAVCLTFAAVLSFFTKSPTAIWTGIVGISYALANVIIFIIIPNLK